MPITLYCWRCACDMPMLTEPEWERIAPHMQKTLLIAEMEAYRRLHGCSPAEARKHGFGAGARVLYEEITGVAEQNFNAIFHHQASLYGPPCGQCGKPLRTPQARLCAMCDWRRPPAAAHDDPAEGRPG